MRPFYFILCLMLSAFLLSACSKPWSNPNYEGSKKVRDYRFDKDSTDCSVMASEKFPLSKRDQQPLYEACMDEKGWKQHRKGDGYDFNTK